MCPGPSRLIDVIIIPILCKVCCEYFHFYVCYSVTMIVGFVISVRWFFSVVSFLFKLYFTMIFNLELVLYIIVILLFNSKFLFDCMVHSRYAKAHRLLKCL